MRVIRCVIPVLSLLVVCGISYGQGAESKARTISQLRRARTPSTRYTGASQNTMAMQTWQGKIYVLNGGTLHKLDQKTMQSEASVKLADSIKKDEPEEKVEEEVEAPKHPLMRYDRDGDGRVTEKEFARPDIIERMDKNGDGALSADELPKVAARPRPRPAAPVISGTAVIRIQDGDILVFVSDKVFKFGTEKLAAKGVAEVPDLTRPDPRARAQAAAQRQLERAKAAKKQRAAAEARRREAQAAQQQKAEPKKDEPVKKENGLF